MNGAKSITVKRKNFCKPRFLNALRHIYIINVKDKRMPSAMFINLKALNAQNSKNADKIPLGMKCHETGKGLTFLFLAIYGKSFHYIYITHKIGKTKKIWA